MSFEMRLNLLATHLGVCLVILETFHAGSLGPKLSGNGVFALLAPGVVLMRLLV